MPEIFAISLHLLLDVWPPAEPVARILLPFTQAKQLYLFWDGLSREIEKFVEKQSSDAAVLDRGIGKQPEFQRQNRGMACWISATQPSSPRRSESRLRS